MSCSFFQNKWTDFPSFWVSISPLQYVNTYEMYRSEVKAPEKRPGESRLLLQTLQLFCFKGFVTDQWHKDVRNTGLCRKIMFYLSQSVIWFIHEYSLLDRKKHWKKWLNYVHNTNTNACLEHLWSVSVIYYLDVQASVVSLSTTMNSNTHLGNLHTTGRRN